MDWLVYMKMPSAGSVPVENYMEVFYDAWVACLGGSVASFPFTSEAKQLF